MSSNGTEPEAAAVPAGLPRVIDIVVAGLGLVVLAPLVLVISVAVKLSSPGPVLFRQLRVGRGGQQFDLLKFRSMKAANGGPQITAAGDSRVTGVGRLLRRTKLDELPSLWNVVRGDMALVGPRPEVPRYVDLDEPGWRLVLSARPGLTDPVTLRLRNEEDLLASVGDPEVFYREVLQPFKLKAYAQYLRTRSSLSDVRVLFATLLAILFPSREPPPSIDEIREVIGTDSDRISIPSSTD